MSLRAGSRRSAAHRSARIHRPPYSYVTVVRPISITPARIDAVGRLRRAHCRTVEPLASAAGSRVVLARDGTERSTAVPDDRGSAAGPPWRRHADDDAARSIWRPCRPTGCALYGFGHAPDDLTPTTRGSGENRAAPPHRGIRGAKSKSRSQRPARRHACGRHPRRSGPDR